MSHRNYRYTRGDIPVVKSIEVGDLVKIAPHATPDVDADPRSQPGIVIDIKKKTLSLPASIYVMWPGMSDTESWFEDALILLE